MNNITKITLALLLIGISIFCLYVFWLFPRYAVPILTYHDFGKGEGITVTQKNFERQIQYLRKKHCYVISLNELVEGIKKGRKFPHNTVVITFDDGYKDNFTIAYPVLKKYGFSATIFLIADKIGVDDKFLNWDEIKEMSKNNIYFGGHTKNHAYLPSIKEKNILWDEMAGSKEIIERHIGIPVDYMSYPNGGFTEEIKAIAKKAGYQGACATNRGRDALHSQDLYALNRISARNRDTSLSLWAKLSGYYNLFRRIKKGD